MATLEQLLQTPDRIEAARFLVPVYERGNNHQGVITALRVLESGPATAAEKQAWLQRIAQLYRLELRQPDLALATLAKAIDVAPSDAGLYAQAEEIAVEAKSVEVLVELLNALVEKSGSAGRAALHKRLAGLCERRLGDDVAALEHLSAALAAMPADLEAVEGLCRLHQKREEWTALAQWTEKRARLEPEGSARIESWRVAGRLRDARAPDAEAALECWLQVLMRAPDDTEALAGVGLATRTLARPALFAQALEKGRAAATSERRWALTFELAQLQADALGAPAAAVALSRELLVASPSHAGARALIDRLVNPTQELLAALATFGAATSRLSLLPQLRVLAAEADALEEVAEAVEAQSENVESSVELAGLLRFAAGLRSELGQHRLATVLWNDLLAVEPNDAEALEHLVRLFRDARDPKSAAEVSLRLARTTVPGAQRHTRFVEAADFLVASQSPGEALAALDESLNQASAVDSPGSLALLQLRRGELLERRGDPAAVAAYAVALKSDELVGHAAVGLQRMLGVPEARAAAARALEPVLRAAGDPRRLAEALEAQVEVAAAGEKLTLLTELAQRWEQAGEPRSALSALLRAYGTGATAAGLRTELERVAGAVGAHDELLGAYEDRLERDPNQKDPALLRRIAELHDALGNRDQAFEAWEWAAEAAPGDAELLNAYAEKCRARGDLARLARVRRWQISASPPGPARTRLLLELANLCEDSLADHAGAAHAYEALVEESPKDRALLKTLQRLYEQTQNTAGLAGVVARNLKLAREENSPEQFSLALRLARLKLSAPADDAGALALLLEVLTQEPENAQAVAALAQLASTSGPVQEEAARLAAPALDKLGDFSSVVQILEAQLATQTGPRERAAILHRIADLHAGPLEDAELGFLAITRALREAPQDPAIFDRCVGLAELTGAADDLDALLLEIAGAQPPGPARVSLFRSLARRRESRGQKDEAISVWSELLAQSPGDAESGARLVALFTEAGRFNDLAVLLNQRADRASPAERPAALLELAAAYEHGELFDEAASTLLALFALTQGLDALIALERVLGLLGRHRERAETLSRLAAAAPNDTERTHRQVQQARALASAGEKLLGVDVHAQVLRRNPSEPRAVADLVAWISDEQVRPHAAALLESVFLGPGEGWQRVAVLEVLSELPGGGHNRTQRVELAGLHESLGDLKQAFAGKLRLVLERPEDDLARAELERLSRSAHLEEELVGAYEDLLERAPPPRLALALRCVVARLYSHELARPALGVRAWEELAALDPSALEPLRELVALHRAGGDGPALGRALKGLAPLLPTRDEQLTALRELATLAEAQLKDLALASGAHRQILERAPKDAAALEALARLLEQLGQPADAAKVLEQQLALAHQRSGDAARLELKLAQLALGPLSRPEEALRFFGLVLQRQPTDAAAVAGLQTLLTREAALRPRIAQLLEGVYRAQGDSTRLAEALELQLSAAPPERQLRLLEELGALRESLHDLPRAFTALRDLYLRTPEDAKVRAELERLAEATGQWQALLQIFRERAGEAIAAEDTIELWRRIARIHQHLGQRVGATEAWGEVARRAPDDVEPLVALCGLHWADHAYDRLPPLLRHRAQLEPSAPKRVALLLELAGVEEVQLWDPAAAIEANRAALIAAPGDPAVLQNLQRLLETNSRFEELAELLSQQVRDAGTAGDDALELGLCVRLASVQHQSLKNDAAALELLGGVLGREGSHPGAIEALQTILRSDRPAAERAAALLERYYQRNGDHAQQLEALEVRAEWSAGEARAGLLHRIADLHLSLDAPGPAFDAVARVLGEFPDDGPALGRALALAGPARAEDRLAELLFEASSRAQHDASRIGMLRPLAQLRTLRAEPAAALEAWRALLLLVPDDAEALGAASQLLEAGSRWGELLEVLERRLKLARGDDERVALLRQLGVLRDDSLADAEGAYLSLRRLLELRPEDGDTLLRLDRLCQVLKRWPELAEVLGRRLHLEPKDRSELLLRLAVVRRVQLDNGAGALPLLGELLQGHPGDPGALGELELLVNEQPGWEPAEDLLLGAYRRGRDVRKLLVLLEACAGRALKPTKRRALWLELAQLRLDQQEDPKLCFAALAHAYRESPSDPALRTRLIEQANVAQCQAELGALLDEVLPQLERQDAAEVSLALGGLCEGPLGKPERAVLLYRKVLELAPQSTERVWPRLDRVLEALSRWTELMPVLEARERAAPEGLEKISLLVRIATLANDGLRQPERAAESWRAVLHRDATHLEAARALEAIYERTGQTERLLEILTHLLGQVNVGQRQQVRLKLARLCIATDPERSIALCRQLLSDEPLNVEAFELLCERLEASGRHPELERALQSRLAVTLAPADAAQLEFRLGELSYRKFTQPQAAAARYRAVLTRMPRHLGALEALREIYESLRLKRELAQVLADLAAAREEPAVKRSHHLRRAEVLFELGDRDASVGAARQALDLAPSDEAELERLRVLLLAQSALPEAARALAGLARLHHEAGHLQQAVVTLFELAGVEGRNANVAGAAAALESVLVHEPTSRPAFDQARAVYSGAQSWPPYAALLARFLPNLPPTERLATHDELAGVHETRLNDLPGALGWAQRAVVQDPASAPRRERAERLAKKLNAVPALAKVYREVLEALPFGAASIAVSLSLAGLEDLQLDQVDAAEQTLSGLLAHDPSNPAALEALAAMFTRRGLHARLAGALELQVEAATTLERRVELLGGLALLHEEKLQAPAAAAHALARLLEVKADVESAQRLVALFRRHQQWPEALSALLKVRMISTTPIERARTQHEIAHLQEQQLQDPEAAVAAFVQALEYEPASADAFRSLERLYTQLKHPSELLRAYELRLPRTHDVEEKIELLYKSAQLWEERTTPLQADRCLEAVVQLRPTEVKALEALARLRRADGRWRPLTEALARHVEIAGLPATRATLCTELGRVTLEHLRDSAGAARWWSRALEYLPVHRPAIKALAKLDQAEGRFLAAAGLLQRDAELETAPAERATRELEVGILKEERLADLPGARASYLRALKVDPLHLPSLRRLRKLYLKAQEWPAYEENLAHEAKRAPSSADRSAAALELARHFEQRAQDPAHATDWYQHALTERPDALEAALPLADLLAAAGAWGRASGVLEGAISVLEREQPVKTRDLVKRLCQLGGVQRQLGQGPRALGTYARALQLDPVDANALRGEVELLDASGRTAEAAARLEQFLAHHAETLERPARAAVRVQLGQMHWKLGEVPKAQASAERVLELDPVHPEALRLLVQIADTLQLFEKAILYRQRLAAVAPVPERFDLLFELGVLAQDKLGSPVRAIEGFVKALELRPEAKAVLQRLHPAYRDAGHNRKATQTLQRLLELTDLTREERRRDTLVLADLLGRVSTELDRAIDLLEAALDEDPAFTSALALVETLLGTAQQWKKLDGCYERMIRRLPEAPATAAARAALLRTLGELRLMRLKDRAGAVAAFEAGAMLLPHDALAQETFADLAIELPDRALDALDAYLRALPTTPNLGKLCAAAVQLAERTGDLDAAFLGARAAVTLAGVPQATHEALLGKLLPKVQVPPRFRSKVTGQQWRNRLLHPAATGSIGELFALIFTEGGHKFGASAGDFKLNPKKHALSLAGASHPSLVQLAEVSSALGFEGLNLLSPYLAPQSSGRREPHADDSASLRIYPTYPLSLVVGEKFLNEPHPAALAALIGSRLAYLRPELSLVMMLPPEQLAIVFEAALSLGEPEYVCKADPKLLKAERKRLDKALDKAALGQLQRLVGKYLPVSRPDDFADYLEGARHSPIRAATLVTGDFAPVRARVFPEGAAADRAVRELLRFALGGDLHALRVETGTQLVAR